MFNISKTVIDKSKIKKFGNSLVVILDRGALKVYNLKEDDNIEIEYKFPEIIIRKAKQEDK